MNEKKEFEYLQFSLKGLGLYERGMDIEEMRSIQNAVNESMGKSSHNFEDDLQAALKESEQIANDSLHNSYESSSHCSISSENSNVVYTAWSSTPPSSPDHPETFSVVAEVHVGWNDSLSELNPMEACNKDEKPKLPAKKIPKKDNYAKSLRKPEDVYSILEVDDDKL